MTSRPVGQKRHCFLVVDIIISYFVGCVTWTADKRVFVCCHWVIRPWFIVNTTQYK